MKTLRNVLVAAAALSAGATVASAQTSATATAPADAKIIQPIAMANGSALSFGTITKPSGASVVRVTAGGSRSVQSGDAALAGGSPTAAAFTITGEPSQTVNISTAATFNLTRVSGSETVTVTPILSATTGSLNGSGSLPFTVGGDLALASSTVTGNYAGTLSVTVNYP